jgi:hypothetical protein
MAVATVVAPAPLMALIKDLVQAQAVIQVMAQTELLGKVNILLVLQDQEVVVVPVVLRGRGLI